MRGCWLDLLFLDDFFDFAFAGVAEVMSSLEEPLASFCALSHPGDVAAIKSQKKTVSRVTNRFIGASFRESDQIARSPDGRITRFLSVDPALSDRVSHAIDGQHVRRDTVIHAVSLGVTHYVIE